MTYQESIDWLYSTQLFGIKLGLDNPRRLLREYLAFPPQRTKVIHVAGTNGKGSVCALIDSVARSTGRRTGLFTSPHLVDFRERIRISGTEISEEDTIRHLTALRELVKDWEYHPTFFELALAVALKHFSENNCELLILETGMGGRLDATTAVPADVAVITPIALDHQEHLGDTLAEIAREKAGIICPTKPVFSAAQAPEARSVIEQEANEQRAPLDFIDEPLTGYSLGLHGPHQLENAALALATLHGIGVHLDYEVVKHGLQNARHPGRFDIIEAPRPQKGARVSNPLHNPSSPSHPPPLVLDIAHNPSSAKALATTWHEKFPNQKAHLIFGLVADKDLHAVLTQLLPLAHELHLIPVNSPRATPPEDIKAALPADPPPVTIHPDLASALASRSTTLPTLLTGSAFLIGEALALLQDKSHRSSDQ